MKVYKEMDLEINGIEVMPQMDQWIVQISVGGSMFFNSPLTTKEGATAIYNNLLRRILP